MCDLTVRNADDARSKGEHLDLCIGPDRELDMDLDLVSLNMYGPKFTNFSKTGLV